MREISEILHQHNLVCTSCREEIMKAIVESPTPYIRRRDKGGYSGQFQPYYFLPHLQNFDWQRGNSQNCNEQYLYEIYNCRKGKLKRTACSFLLSEMQQRVLYSGGEREYSGLPDCFQPEEAGFFIKGYCKKCN